MSIGFSYEALEHHNGACLTVSSGEYLKEMKKDEVLTIETLRVAIAIWVKGSVGYYTKALNYFENPKAIVDVMGVWANTFNGTFIFDIAKNGELMWVEVFFRDENGNIETVIKGEIDSVVQTVFSPMKSVSLSLKTKIPNC